MILSQVDDLQIHHRISYFRLDPPGTPLGNLGGKQRHSFQAENSTRISGFSISRLAISQRESEI